MGNILLRIYLLLVGVIALTLPKVIFADVVKLHLPMIVESPGNHLFYHELLETALEEAGHTPELTSSKYPQLRIKKYLDIGKVSLFWMLESSERNVRYIPINIGITNGLIGKRILFIKAGDQPLYARVNTLADFRKLNLVAGMGANWFDAKVWQANNLQYKELEGNWESIYKMIPHGRSFNYISRGINEIIRDSKRYPGMEIEQNLVLIYDRDSLFYLSSGGENPGEPYKEILSESMVKAKESGLIERLVTKYWGSDFEALNYDQRLKLYLETPK